MDGNKDDALKSLKIGKEALDAGDRARALKFITKARRLDPTLQVDDLLSKAEAQSDSQSESINTDDGLVRDRSGQSPSDRQQPSLRSRARPAGSSSSTATYSEDQIAIVRQIKKKKDYYEILGLERSCTVEDVRKAYRKLSLKVHPDKNQAPGAEEAFKAVSKAFQCLSDEESRKKYDLTGLDEPVHVPRARRGPAAQGFNGFYEADFDPDEIFRNFFFGGMHPATTQYRGFSFGTGMGPRNGDNGSSGFNLRMLIQLLPVILILLLNFLPSSEPVYSLSRSYPYEYKYTSQRSVNYYVKSATKFDQDYPPSSPERVALEGKIERDYISILAQNCRVEMQRRQWGFIKEMPHCDLYQKFQGVA